MFRFYAGVIRDDTLIMGCGGGGFEGETGIFPRLGLMDPGGCVFFRYAWLLFNGILVTKHKLQRCSCFRSFTVSIRMVGGGQSARTGTRN